MMLLENNTLAALIVILPFIGAAVIPLLQRSGDKVIAWSSVIICALMFVFVLLLIPETFFGATTPIDAAYNWIPAAGISFSVHIDPLAVFMALIVTGIGALTVLYSTKYMMGKEGLPRYYSLVILFLGSMVGLVFIDNLLVLFFFWEVMGLCSYALIGFHNKDPTATRAGIRAFVVMKVADIGLLIGILVLFAGSGTWSITELIQLASDNPPTYVAFAAFCFIIGAMGMSVQVPFHAWLPEMRKTPITVNTLVQAVITVNAGIYLLARTMPLFIEVPGWTTIILAIGLVTALLGALMALAEYDLKRLLAYATISQAGYMFIALGLGLPGFLACLLHMLSYAVFMTVLLLSSGVIIQALGTSDMRKMGGLKSKMKGTHICMLLGTLSLAGMVPLSSFWSTGLIFTKVFDANMIIPLFLLFITAMLTVTYAFRMYYMIFWGQPRSTRKVSDAPLFMTIPIVILTVCTLECWIIVDYLGIGFMDFGFTGVEAYSLGGFIQEVFGNIGIVLFFAAFGIGYLLFHFRKRIAANKTIQIISILPARGFGFNELYSGLVIGLKEVGVRMHRIETGHTKLNIFVIVLVLLLLISILFGVGTPVGIILIVLSLIAMTFGNMMAFIQLAVRKANLKRTLLYSTIAHTGYILLGIGIWLESENTTGLQGSLFHIIALIFILSLATICVWTVIRTIGSGEIVKMRGIGRTMPTTSLGLSIALLSLAGVAPLCGFTSFWLILGSSVQAGDTIGAWGVIIAMIAAINIIISLGYYLPIIKTFYLSPSRRRVGVKDARMVMLIPIIILTAVTITLGVWPELGLKVVAPIIEALV